MPAETLFAELEERGYRRDQMGRLTRDYVSRVLSHPRKRARDGTDLGIDRNANRDRAQAVPRDEALRQLYRSYGWPEWRVEKKVTEIMRQ